MSQDVPIVYTENKLSTEFINDELYPLFHASVETIPFLTTDTRREIIRTWSEMCPNIREINLRQCLNRMERSYYENMEIMDREGIRNRILEQQQYMNGMIMTSKISDDKKARAIVESNKLVASVAQLSDMAPQIEIKIETNAPSDLSIRMNRAAKGSEEEI